LGKQSFAKSETFPFNSKNIFSKRKNETTVCKKRFTKSELSHLTQNYFLKKEKRNHRLPFLEEKAIAMCPP